MTHETNINASNNGGSWDIIAPDNVTIATSRDPQTGFTTGLRIFIDFTYDQWINAKSASIHFIGPVATPIGPPQTGKYYRPDLVLHTTLEIRNDLGVPMQGLSLNLVNDDANVNPGRDNRNAHPDDYAHFHQILETSLIDKASGNPDTTLNALDPTLQTIPKELLGEPLQDHPSPSIIDTFGIIQPDAIAHLGGANDDGTFTLHSENTPGPTGGNFTLSWFTLDTPNGDPKAPDPNTVRVFPTNALPIEVNDHKGDGKTYIFAGISTAKEDLPSLVFADKSTNTVAALKVAGNGAVEPFVFGDIQLGADSTVTVNDGIQASRGVFTIEEAPTAHLILNGKSTLTDLSTVAITSIDNRGGVTLNGDLTLGADGGSVINIGAHLDGTGMVFISADNERATVNAVDGVTFNISAGTLNIEHPTDFHGTVGPIGPTGIVNLFQTADVTHAAVETATRMLHLLNDKGVDRGDIHLVGDVSGMTLNRTLPSDSFIALQDGGGTGNIAIKFT
jgi:hypothetical protein